MWQFRSCSSRAGIQLTLLVALDAMRWFDQWTRTVSIPLFAHSFLFQSNDLRGSLVMGKNQTINNFIFVIKSDHFTVWSLALLLSPPTSTTSAYAIHIIYLKRDRFQWQNERLIVDVVPLLLHFFSAILLFEPFGGSILWRKIYAWMLIGTRTSSVVAGTSTQHCTAARGRQFYYTPPPPPQNRFLCKVVRNREFPILCTKWRDEDGEEKMNRGWIECCVWWRINVAREGGSERKTSTPIE